jgi:hypothetical protein
MVSLSTWLDECHPTTSPENIGESLFGIQDGQIERRLSNVARNQLRSIAAKGIEETELAIFSAFDHSMEKFGPNPQDAAIIGLCLRRLALIYRRMLKRYKIFFHDCKSQYFQDSGARF